MKVGDTITTVDNPCEKPIEGFENVKPMVFVGIYPVRQMITRSLEALWKN